MAHKYVRDGLEAGQKIWLVTLYLESTVKRGWPLVREYVSMGSQAPKLTRVPLGCRLVEKTVEDITEREVGR